MTFIRECCYFDKVYMYILWYAFRTRYIFSLIFLSSLYEAHLAVCSDSN